MLSEVVGQKLHGICSQTRDILVLAGILCSQGFDFLHDKIAHFHPNFQSEDQGFRKYCRQAHWNPENTGSADKSNHPVKVHLHSKNINKAFAVQWSY